MIRAFDAMIDLHCHILPGIDDGAADLAVSLRMAQLLVADGVTIAACTPHILPGLYNNTGAGIREAVSRLQYLILQEQIPLRLVAGADVHIAPDLIQGLNSGDLPTLNGSRYALIEPPHDVLPPRLEEVLTDLLAAGYVPILTHPERLSWVSAHYHLISHLAQSGVWMQITAGSLAGAFGGRARSWAERMLQDGYVHLIASDAHDDRWRPPDLRRGWELAASLVGEPEADNLLLSRPRGVIEDTPPSLLPLPAGVRFVSGETYVELGQPARGMPAKKSLRQRTAGHAGLGAIPDRLRRLFG